MLDLDSMHVKLDQTLDFEHTLADRGEWLTNIGSNHEKSKDLLSDQDSIHHHSLYGHILSTLQRAAPTASQHSTCRSYLNRP